MATHSSIFAWKIPWTESLMGCSPQGHMTEHACVRGLEGAGGRWVGSSKEVEPPPLQSFKTKDQYVETSSVSLNKW